jgi:beta-glucuronidase
MRVVVIAAVLGGLVAPIASAAPSVPAERALYADGPTGRYLLDAGWQARRASSSRWTPVSVPDAFNARDLNARGFRGGVRWYRDRFVAPAADAATTGWALRFEAVNRRATVWLNGRRLGGHDGAYEPFELAAGRALRPGAVNTLLVKVDGRQSRRVLPPSSRPRGWWNFAGILREVYLRRLTGFDVTQLAIDAAPGTSAAITATVRNAGPVPADMAWSVDVSGPGGFSTTVSGDAGVVAPGASVPVRGSFDIAAPLLWGPGHPNLYDATLTVPGGQVRETHFGVRSWSVVDGRAQLNGEPLSLRGASFHEDSVRHGAALTAADRAALVADLQAIGATFTREHYPPHPALLEAFDRLGIVVWEQVPVWRLTGAQLAGPLGDQALALLRTTVARDRSHASVMAWSVENETQAGGAGERSYVQRAARLVRALDPTRLVAADASLSPLRGLSPALNGLDAIGLNEYVGWYGGILPGTLRSLLGAVARRFAHPALFVTETGAEANRSGSARTKGTYAFQERFLDRTFDVLDADPRLSGALVWALRDFPVRPGWSGGNPRPSPPMNAKGLYRRDGSAKPAARAIARRFRATSRPLASQRRGRRLGLDR